MDKICKFHAETLLKGHTLQSQYCRNIVLAFALWSPGL